jgi:hypothetical protein
MVVGIPSPPPLPRQASKDRYINEKYNILEFFDTKPLDITRLLK